MPNSPQQRDQSTPGQRESESRRGLLRLGEIDLRYGAIKRCAFLAVFVFFSITTSAQTAILTSAAGGFTITGPNPILPTPTYHAGFGSINGLGIGSAGAGLTKIAVAGGEFYYTPFNFVLAGANPGHPVVIDAYLSTSFANSSSVLQLMACPSPGPCTSFSSYNAIPTSQAAEIIVLPTQTSSGTYTAYLGLFVGNVNGTVTSPDSATVTFDIEDDRHNIISQARLQLDNPNETVQTAVQLQLATAPSGLTISAGGTTDYAANFGTVNGLGVGPGAGLTVVTGQAPGGVIYSTPYLIQPAYSGFSSFSSTKITVYVSTDFVHPAVLKLYDSQSQLAGYNAISKNSGSPTQVTGSASNGTSITEYLGLFVSNLNGAGAFRGADKATLTYTITVQ